MKPKERRAAAHAHYQNTSPNNDNGAAAQQEKDESPSPHVVVPDIGRDFCFIPPGGGPWCNFRRRSVWNSRRLRRLATEYRRLDNDSKRDFLYKAIISQVEQVGGRFVQGCRVQSALLKGIVVYDPDEIMTNLMRILRQMPVPRQQQQQQQEQPPPSRQDVLQSLGQAEASLQALRAMVQGGGKCAPTAAAAFANHYQAVRHNLERAQHVWNEMIRRETRASDDDRGTDTEEEDDESSPHAVASV